jgi:hypothetical protein
MRIRVVAPAVLPALSLCLAAAPALADDIVLTPPSGGGVSVTNAAGSITNARVADDGLTLTGNLALPHSTEFTGNIVKNGTSFLHDFGTSNVFLGLGAGNFFMTGTLNVAVGTQAFLANATGGSNVAMGFQALANNTTGSGNTALGRTAMTFNMTGGDNTAVGFAALNANTASYNTAVGSGSLQANTTGNLNAALGFQSLVASTTGSNNTALGAYALYNNATADSNTAVGSQAMQNNLTGTKNTAVGASALFTSQTGNYNSAVGFEAMTNSTTGLHNAALGYQALRGNSTGYNNVAVGSNALVGTTTGSSNTGVGYHALPANVAGTSNSAFGANALSVATGGNNTAIGTAALVALTSGQGNIALGSVAGYQITAGDYNIMIGNIGTASDTNTIRIGESGTHTKTFLAGIRGTTTANNNAVTVVVDSAGQLGTVSSSRRFKDDIADMGERSSALMKLRPVTFHYKSDPAQPRALQYGLVAEEVAEVYPGLVAWGDDGQAETVMYRFLAPMLLNEYQKQQRTIEAQAREARAWQAKVDDLERERDTQRAEIASLRAAVADVAALREESARLARAIRRIEEARTLRTAER